MSDCKMKCPKCGGINSFNCIGDIFNPSGYVTRCIKCGHTDKFVDGEYLDVRTEWVDVRKVPDD